MKPVIALIGRPNVGKSTLFNQFTRTRNALVADMPGLTRDRQYGDAVHENKSFIVIDTGGLGESDEGIDSYMAEQARTAIQEADIVLFVVDARAGLLGSDEMIAGELRQLNKPFYLVVNKIDGLHEEAAVAEFYRLGLAERMFSVAASHGRGLNQLLSDVLESFPEDAEDAPIEETGIKIAIVGRPNVGKSTLVNRMLGEDRVVVYDMPGTTRDSIYIPYERMGQKYTLIDTAGVRRRGRSTRSWKNSRSSRPCRRSRMRMWWWWCLMRAKALSIRICTCWVLRWRAVARWCWPSTSGTA
jgi:GTP-binding protein